jgi:hypothetical protein
MHKWIEARNQGNETQKHPWMRKLIISNLVEKKQRRQLEKDLVGPKGMMIMMMITMMTSGGYCRDVHSEVEWRQGQKGQKGGKTEKSIEVS